MSGPNDKRRSPAPLRQIVGFETGAEGTMLEVLACGHKQPEQLDVRGRRYAHARQCAPCGVKLRELAYRVPL